LLARLRISLSGDVLDDSQKQARTRQSDQIRRHFTEVHRPVCLRDWEG
jgi:hypothetical protein